MRRPAPTQSGPVDHHAADLIALFTAVADRWKLTVVERCALLAVERATHDAWAGEHPPRTLTTDQRTRIALLVAIDVELNAFYGLNAENAATHVRRPHTAPSGRGTALDVMLAGPGYLGIANVREHVAALNGRPVTATRALED